MNQEHIDKLKTVGNFFLEENQGEPIITVSSTAATSTNPYKVYSNTLTWNKDFNLTCNGVPAWDDKWVLWQ